MSTFLHRVSALGDRWHRRRHSERGDVPGWVMVTLMTAALVVAIWAVAQPLLVQLFQKAIQSVSGIGA